LPEVPPFRPTRSPAEARAATGVACALAAFGIWGLFPLYFKALAAVLPPEMLAHRIVWSVVVLTAVALPLRGLAAIRLEAASWRRLGQYGVTTVLIATNWLVYIWAVDHGRILEASLGYYINPLVNVLLGIAVLGERLSRLQAVAVAVAAAGVLVLVIKVGTLPWLALVLALSFGSYALVRKTIGGDPLIGLLIEATLLMPPALGYLVWLGVTGGGAFGGRDATTTVLLAAAGVLTAAPLLLFVSAAQRLQLATLGVLQYITPTGQFLLAVLVFGEAFTAAHALAFGCIWAALAVFTADAWNRRR
jgi:chloramphenicol-sensitive protein RarD